MVIVTNSTNYINIANAIRNKAGVTSKFKPIEMADAILNIGVNTIKIAFVDYDNTTVASYTLEEIAELTELPTPPSHDNLTFNGWNLSLDAIKELKSTTIITPKYSTIDGATMITINVSEDSDCKFEFEYLQSMIDIDGESISTTVSWGDGTSNEFTDASVIASHTYEQPGDYVISILPNDNTIISFNEIESKSYITRFKNIKRMVRIINFGKNIYISYNDYLFDSFSSLLAVNIPNNVTNIGSYAFQNCTSLTSIIIPDGITNIGSYAFRNCTSLTSIIIPDGVTKIGSYAFQNCTSLTSIIIPDSVTSIGGAAFDGCNSLTSITIPDGVTSIGSSAFYGCKSLTSINIPGGITSIGYGAFQNCTSLTSITIPDGVTSIGGSAFDGCSSLTSINIPDGVKSIGGSAFYRCSSLTSITIPDSVTSIGNGAFSGCSSLTSITIPDSVTSIGNYPFWGCIFLTSINIPNGVTSISYEAFYGCSSLTSITIPDSVTSIGEGAFNGCNSLTSIIIPDSVTSIGSDAFSGCICMKEYHIKPTTPPTLNYRVFSDIPSDCIIYVPAGTLNTYKTANRWSSYANYMQEEPDEPSE